jgi:hypothetical protein
VFNVAEKIGSWLLGTRAGLEAEWDRSYHFRSTSRSEDRGRVIWGSRPITEVFSGYTSHVLM